MLIRFDAEKNTFTAFLALHQNLITLRCDDYIKVQKPGDAISLDLHFLTRQRKLKFCIISEFHIKFTRLRSLLIIITRLFLNLRLIIFSREFSLALFVQIYIFVLLYTSLIQCLRAVSRMTLHRVIKHYATFKM